MKKQRYGKIINISSVTWMMGRPYRLDYVTSKAGVVGLTHAIAPELGEYDINVNAVVLGLVQSDWPWRRPRRSLPQVAMP